MICHIDADSFFASVLQRKNPRLKNIPLLALGMGGGCVIAASYEAKKKGVKTGMPLKEAQTLCPEAQALPCDFGETALASEQMEGVLMSHAPDIEQYSIDEWFVDLRTCPGGIPFDLLLWAKELREEILAATDISVSIGVAPSKTLAKMASDARKPAGLVVVEKRDIEQFLCDLPAAAIPGIGRARQAHAAARKWVTAWDIAEANQEIIQKLFGRPGLELQKELLGTEVYALATEDAPPKSISRCRSFPATRDTNVIWAHALKHLSIAVERLRGHELTCRGVAVWIRDHHFHYDGRRLRLPQTSTTEETIAPFVRRLLSELLRRHRSCTQVGLCLWDLHPLGSTQFSLFHDPKETVREEELQKSLDRLRKRFGRNIVMKGSMLPVAKEHDRLLNLSILE